MVSIAIELLVIIVILGVLGIWFLWEKLSSLRARKKYNPNNDRGKQGEEHRKELIKGGVADPIRELTDTTLDIPRPPIVEEPRVLPTTTSSESGEVSGSDGKTSSRPRNFFKRIRRRKPS